MSRNTATERVTHASSLDRACDTIVGNMSTVSRAVRFRPCIDIHNGKVKQIVGSTLRDGTRPGDAASETPATNFETEIPSTAYAEMYKRDGIYGGHAILLSKDEATTRAAMEATRVPGRVTNRRRRKPVQREAVPRRRCVARNRH